MIKKTYAKFIYLGLFATSMGYLEAAVVVYLRKIIYPNNFLFPLVIDISNKFFFIEIARELSTIIILFMVAVLAGKKFIERFSYFLYIFAIWDIFYYLFLKITINWPASFLDWDILFLIPIPWTSPVLAPLVCSLTMIILSSLVFYLFKKYPSLINLSKVEWALFSIGTSTIFISFIWEFTSILIKNFYQIIYGKTLDKIISVYIPDRFHWEIFGLGEALIIISMVLLHWRTSKK